MRAHSLTHSLTLIIYRTVSLYSSAKQTDVSVTDANSPYGSEPHRSAVLLSHTQRPFNAEPPLTLLLDKYLTPNDIFYVRNHLPVPHLDATTYRFTLSAKGTHCIYIYIYVCVCVCVCVCVYECVHKCVHVILYMYGWMCKCVCIVVALRSRSFSYLCTHPCAFFCFICYSRHTQLRTRSRVYVTTHTHTHTHAHNHTYFKPFRRSSTRAAARSCNTAGELRARERGGHTTVRWKQTEEHVGSERG
jgi:hypothetical protein